MKKINFAKFLQFGFMILLFLQTTETSAQKTEKIVLGKRLPKDDSLAVLNRARRLEKLQQKDTLFSFKRIAIEAVKTKNIVCDTITKNTIYNSHFFKKTDYKFQNAFEKTIVLRKLEKIDSVSVYEFNRRINRGAIFVEYLFDAIDTDTRMVMSQSQIIEFCKSKNVKKWFRKNKNGEIYFILKCDVPKFDAKISSGDVINSNNKISSFYLSYNANYAKVTRSGLRLTINYYSRAVREKFDTKLPALFVVAGT